MDKSNLLNIKTDNSWAFIELNEKNKVSDFNEKAVEYYPDITMDANGADIHISF
jgi:hypothetical protein